MAYNRFLYNTALYNAGREEVAAIATSLIQAHTGPHIKAVIGGTGGVTFLSDFVTREGTKPLPSSYRFPDLTALIKAQETDTDDLPAYLRAWAAKDLPAAIYLVDRIPDIRAVIFGLLQADLMATILGQLATKDLAAIIEALKADLPAQVFSQYAPDLRAIMSGQLASDLGGLIWSPLDLPAYLQPVYLGDLPGYVRGFQFSDLPGQMLGIPAPELSAFLRAFEPGTSDLPAVTSKPAFPGDMDISGLIYPIGPWSEFSNLGGTLGPLSTGDIGASIGSGDDFDLRATLQLLAAKSLPGSMGAIPLGERDRFLPGYLQPMRLSDLNATMTINENVAFLGASIFSLHDTTDLGAFLRVAETFITAILTVSTMASRSLRATIGSPGCAGGSAIDELSATMLVQHARSLGAFVESYVARDLGASINTTNIFHAFDTIGVVFAPFLLSAVDFNATDTISITFSPFRGKDLGAAITAILSNTSLGASITPTFPLFRVVPAVNRLTAAELRLDREQDIQEIRLQLEGILLEYLYVHGTDVAFIRDPNEDWKINIRSFRPLAEGLFGDHAAGRVCRLGNLESYATLDQAVRACIQAVIGLEDEGDLGATIAGTGGYTALSAFVNPLTPGVDYVDLGGLANRVYPVDFGATISGSL